MQNELEYLLGIRSYMLEYHTNIMHEGSRAGREILPTEGDSDNILAPGRRGGRN